MSAILKFYFQKRKQLHFSEEKLSKLQKEETILHVTITFSLKKGFYEIGPRIHYTTASDTSKFTVDYIPLTYKIRNTTPFIQ